MLQMFCLRINFFVPFKISQVYVKRQNLNKALAKLETKKRKKEAKAANKEDKKSKKDGSFGV